MTSTWSPPPPSPPFPHTHICLPYCVCSRALPDASFVSSREKDASHVAAAACDHSTNSSSCHGNGVALHSAPRCEPCHLDAQLSAGGLLPGCPCTPSIACQNAQVGRHVPSLLLALTIVIPFLGIICVPGGRYLYQFWGRGDPGVPTHFFI